MSVKQIGGIDFIQKFTHFPWLPCHSERSQVFCHSERGTSRGIDATTMFPISSEERAEKSYSSLGYI